MSDEERAALILKMATRLMRAGRTKGWSDALRLAKEQLAQKVGEAA